MQKTGISIILPCYNEGSIFKSSVSEIISTLRTLGTQWEIIFVEDVSSDETKKTVLEILKSNKNCRAIFHRQNEGRGKTVSDGIKNSKGEICGFLDVDLEVSASYIPIFVKEIENGFDMAVGKRFYDQESSSFVRFVASKMYALIVKVFLGLPISDTEAGYKFFRKDKILPVVNKTLDKNWFWDTEVCARAHLAGLKISQVPVLFVKKPQKKSTVRLLPDTFKYLAAIVRFRLNGK